MAFHVMAKPIGSICNLDCTYCFYLEKEKLYPSNRKPQMSAEVLETYIQQMVECNPEEPSFAWQGGEPTLLGVDYFREIVRLQKKHAPKTKVANALQTNGVLLNDEWCEFLGENEFLVGLSIDGPEHLHDTHRIDKGGKPSFHRVMKGLEMLKKHKVEFNTLTVVHRQNADHALEIYEFLKSIGSHFHQFIPLVERFSDEATTDGLVRRVGSEGSYVGERSVLPEQWGEFLCNIFDHWVREDVGQIFIQLFEVALQSYMGLPQGLCLFLPTCGDAVAIEHTGDLYSCDHYVFPENRLGQIMETPLASLVGSPKQREFGKEKLASLPAYCQRCDVRGACNGECPKNRFLTTPDGEPGLNYLCRGYKRFFRHIAPQMLFLGHCLKHERPATEVMAWTKARDNQATVVEQGKNRP